jgi:hypothetical protein
MNASLNFSKSLFEEYNINDKVEVEIVNEYENITLQYVGKVKEFLMGRRFSFGDENSDVPDEAGVYAIFNERGEVIYIGRTKNLTNPESLLNF